MKDILNSGFAAMNVAVTNEALEKFVRYYELLTEYNKKVNLTAITAPDEVAVKHFLDSASLFGIYEPQQSCRVIDVGTGAGFPGLPLKIVRGDIQLTLADSLAKRVDFLKLCVSELGLDGVECIHARAEELAKKDGYRESFDIAVSRAVANMATLCEYCLPFVKVGGLFAGAKNAAETLGGGNTCIKLAQIAEHDLSHSIVFIDKMRPTPPKYPRGGNKASSKPL